MRNNKLKHNIMPTAIGIGISPMVQLGAVLNLFQKAITDGHTIAYYDLADLDTLVFNGETNGVLQVKDKLLSGRDLKQSDTTKGPLYQYLTNSLQFNGVSHWMATDAFTWDQPCFIYALIKQITWTANEGVMGSKVGFDAYLAQGGATPNLSAFAGNNETGNTNLAVNTWGIIRLKFHGASGTFQIDDTAVVNSNFGTAAMGGVTLGAFGGGLNKSNIEVKAIILRDSADDATTQGIIYDELAKKKMSYSVITSGDNRFFVPPTFKAGNKVILYCHGVSEDEDAIITDTKKNKTFGAFFNQGWGVITSLGGGDAWGNQTSLDAYYDLITWAKTQYSFTDIAIYAMSMGGLPGLQMFMQDTQFTKYIGIENCTNLDYLFNTGGFKADIKIAYGFALDADYSTATTGHDPMLLDGSLIGSRKMELVASESDLIVNKDNNTDLFFSTFDSVADITMVTATGNHGDISHFDADRDVAFLKS